MSQSMQPSALQEPGNELLGDDDDFALSMSAFAKNGDSNAVQTCPLIREKNIVLLSPIIMMISDG